MAADTGIATTRHNLGNRPSEAVGKRWIRKCAFVHRASGDVYIQRDRSSWT